MTKEESVLDEMSKKWLDGKVDSEEYFEDARQAAREDYIKGVDESVKSFVRASPRIAAAM